jgi:hypothetical protein
VPNYLSLVMQVAADEGVEITFSQARYTARRIEKRDDAHDAMDPYAYVLQHWDETGETAVKNVMDECAARRINKKAASVTALAA